MPWIKASDFMPPENEPVVIYDERHGKMRVGRYIGGGWLVEDERSGQLNRIEEVTHWSWMLDSETDWDAGDD